MKPRVSKCREAGLTLFEVGLIVAVLMLLFAVSLPLLTKPKVNHRAIACVNNLKQIGLATRIWEGDNGDMNPMGVSVTNGSSLEMAATGDVIQTFMVMSNELSTPLLLLCPDDASRTRALTFPGLSNRNISYFVDLDATNDLNPARILHGDCNLEQAGAPLKRGLASLWTNDPVAWDATRHVHGGNLCFADGSVQQTTSLDVQQCFVKANVVTNRLAIP